MGETKVDVVVKYKLSIKRMIERTKEPILAVLAALLISNFIISHTKVPTASMINTIAPGDHLIVSRIPYYYRDPKPGEIIVFGYQNDYLIKRVVGVPGDQIDIIENYIYVNGVKLEETYVAEEGCTYLFAGSDIKFPYVVPPDTYFVMGDNRKNSKDSRVFGAIRREQIVAKAGLRIYPLNRIGMIH